MALLHFDSFENYEEPDDLTVEYTAVNPSDLALVNEGLGGRRAVRTDREDYAFGWDAGVGLTEEGTGVSLFAAFDIKLSNGSSLANEPIISFGTSGTGYEERYRDSDTYAYIRPDDSMTNFIVWAMVDGSNTNVGTIAINDSAAHRMEISLTPSSAEAAGDGELLIFLDGVELFSYSGDISGVGLPLSRVIFGGPGGNASAGIVDIGALAIWDSTSPGFNTFPMGPVVIDQIDAQNTDLASDDGDTSTVTLPTSIDFADGSASANAIGARGFLKARTAGGQSNRAVNLELNASSESVSKPAVVLVAADYKPLFTPVLEVTSSDLSDTSIVVSDL